MIKTITELKQLWIDGFIPTETDYEDLFDTIEDLSANAGGGGGGLTSTTTEVEDTSLGNGNKMILTRVGDIVTMNYRVYLTQGDIQGILSNGGVYTLNIPQGWGFDIGTNEIRGVASTYTGGLMTRVVNSSPEDLLAIYFNNVEFGTLPIDQDTQVHFHVSYKGETV